LVGARFCAGPAGASPGGWRRVQFVTALTTPPQSVPSHIEVLRENGVFFGESTGEQFHLPTTARLYTKLHATSIQFDNFNWNSIQFN